jgi:hypothetical protein
VRRSGRNGGREDDPGQLHIEWDKPADKGQVTIESPLPASGPRPPVQRLKWDFKTTFPEPMPEAIDAGVIGDEDATPANVRALHQEHARESLAVLRDLDRVLDARRRGVDPRNNKAPMLTEAKERLQKFFETEPARLERWWQTLMDTYEEVFGGQATEAFGKAVRAWHAESQVTDRATAAPPTAATPVREPQSAPAPASVPRNRKPHRIVARLPVPRPLPASVAAGNFGQDDEGPVRPQADEVRAITERHAEKLIELLDTLAQTHQAAEQARLQAAFRAALGSYCEDFGQHAADQLEAYVRRQAGLDPSSRHER